jgi:hypothetical protein
VNLKLATSTSRAAATAWLVTTGQRIAPTLHRPFAYRERRFRWDGVEAVLPDGRGLDWFCRGSLRPIWHIDGLTDLRSFPPPAPGWFTSTAAASNAGCELAPMMCFPTGCYRQPDDASAPRVTSERR